MQMSNCKHDSFTVNRKTYEFTPNNRKKTSILTVNSLFTVNFLSIDCGRLTYQRKFGRAKG